MTRWLQAALALLLLLRRALTTLWIRINKALVAADWTCRPTTDLHHKIVVVGDGFAEGIGYWVVPGGQAGVARFLARQILSENNVRVFFLQSLVQRLGSLPLWLCIAPCSFRYGCPGRS